MTDTQKKSQVFCGCKGGKGKDIIVITIETCCRKTCDGLKAEKKPQELETIHEPKPFKQPSRGEYEVTDTETYESDPSKLGLQQRKGEHEVTDTETYESDPSKLGLQQRKGEHEVTDTETYESDPSKLGLQQRKGEHEVTDTETYESDPSKLAFHQTGLEVPVNLQSSERKHKPELRKSEEYSKNLLKVDQDSKRVFKLPVLLERHHGPGCAMEINVLEKHENTCLYKKDNIEGRSPDDRVGSYECIGRLVFRTCNPNEMETDSSGTSGVNGGASPSKIIGATKSAAVSSSPKAPPLSPTLSESRLFPSPSAPPLSPPPTPSASQVSKQPSLPSPTGSKNYISAKSDFSALETKIENESQNDFESSKTLVEETIHSETQEPLLAFRKNRNPVDMQHLMMAATPVIPECPGCKKHFPGDDCRLHGPRNPLLWPPVHSKEKIFASKKLFPVYADESNQTDIILKNAQTTTKRSKQSLPTIASLSDLSRKIDKPKKNFFGSLFRKSSIKSTSTGDSRRFRTQLR